MIDTAPVRLDAFREEIRSFVATQLPPDMAKRSLTGFHSSKNDQQTWGRILYARGWSAPLWPAAHGGANWTPEQMQIFDEECYLAGAPEMSWNGIRLVGPVIYTFGNEEQKAQFLAPTIRWDVFWGQGFSEPSSGSDLASLRTSAARDGDYYVVNGSKMWMTDGHFAEWLFCLVRTSTTGKKQEGISFLLIDARTDGVELRPITSIDGQHTLNQVFFTNVRVPIGNRVGPEGAGWSHAKFLLANERTSSAEVPRCKFYRQRLRHLGNKIVRNGRPLLEDRLFSRRLAELDVDLLALEASVLEVMSAREPTHVSAAQTSVLKLKGSHLLQVMGELMVDAIGADAILALDANVLTAPNRNDLPVGDHVPGIISDFLYRRAATIYGGSAEIQRNIIASNLLPPPV